jgi:low temperature requirement protein LtrA
VLALLLAACLWWAYFGGDDTRAEHALAAVSDDRRGWVAIQAFGYWHLLMLLGIIAMAAGLKDVVGHAFDPLDLAHALLLSGGVAIFLAGDVLFRHTLHIGPGRLRALAATLAWPPSPSAWPSPPSPSWPPWSSSCSARWRPSTPEPAHRPDGIAPRRDQPRR